MSKIKLPHASGNSMSIGAPATNPASDLELKLPATIGTAGQVLRNSSTPGTLEFGGLGGGITMVDSWKINTAYSQSAGHGAVTANWERMVTNGPQLTSIGSPLTESSGVFTFPSTGKYWIQFHFLGKGDSAGSQDYVGARIFVSQNAGVGFNQYSWAYTNDWSNHAYFNCSNICILDVANTTNTLFQMNTECHSNTIWFGNSLTNRTASGFTVMRLGDT